MNQMNGTLNVYDVAEGGLANAVFFQRALERAFRFRAFRKWVTDRRSLDALVEALDGTVVHANQQDDNVAIVLDVADATFYSSLKLMPESSSEFRIDVLAASRGAAKQLRASRPATGSESASGTRPRTVVTRCSAVSTPAAGWNRG